MAIQLHLKGSHRRAVTLRQMNASAIRRGLPPLVLAVETKKREAR